MAKLSALLYDPNQSFEVQVFDLEYRHDGTTSWRATIYQPQGTGPFPALLDVHGGAWNHGERSDNQIMNQALAASGMVVAAVDYRLAPQHPYPAQVEDINYATRWLKLHAADFNTVPASVGALGASSGGHTVMLSALRPQDPRYCSLALPGGEEIDANLLYVIGAWPVLDPYVRYHYAREVGDQRLVESSEAYFLTVDTMREANPQQILDRGEKVHLPPTLIVQGTADNNVPLSIPNNFVQAFGAAGGSIDLELFPQQPHGFGNTPGPDSSRALELMKAFVARQLARTAAAV